MTRKVEVYVPSGRPDLSFTPTDASPFGRSTSPVSTRSPLALNTRTAPKAPSTGSLNRNATSLGCFSTVMPRAGEVCWRIAWPLAGAAAASSRKAVTAASRATLEKRLLRKPLTLGHTVWQTGPDRLPPPLLQAGEH